MAAGADNPNALPVSATVDEAANLMDDAKEAEQVPPEPRWPPRAMRRTPNRRRPSRRRSAVDGKALFAKDPEEGARLVRQRQDDERLLVEASRRADGDKAVTRCGPPVMGAGGKAGEADALVGVVITVPHVFLPLDENGNGREDWAAPSVSTTKVLKRARLEVPLDLAVFLSERDQAEILSAPLKAGLSAPLEAGERWPMPTADLDREAASHDGHETLDSRAQYCGLCLPSPCGGKDGQERSGTSGDSTAGMAGADVSAGSAGREKLSQNCRNCPNPTKPIRSRAWPRPRRRSRTAQTAETSRPEHRLTDPTSHIPCATACAYPARPGNRVRSLIDGEEIARRIGEAVEAARHSVWLTVAFYSDDFLFPDGMGPLFDVLDRAVARGVDVRLLVWRQNPEARPSPRVFNGSPAERALLAGRGARFRIRWDRAGGVYCQHQKSWVIDAGQPGETAFVGGLNLTSVALRLHDVYLEVSGPSATDVRHNFVERWNEASERHAPDGNWGCDATDALPYAMAPREPQGSSTVQIQRMLDPGRYPAARVERSILEQYERAIDAARRTIYIENQAIPIPEVARPLLRAVERGVEVVLLVPAIAEDYVYEARHDPREAARFAGIEALAPHTNFTFAGITEQRDGRRRAAYVHAKMMLVDDAWLTVGSCNLHAFSLAGHSEMNASVWDAAVAREMRCRLFARHLGVDTAPLDDRAALALFRHMARANGARLADPAHDWQGRVFTMLPELYARPSAPWQTILAS